MASTLSVHDRRQAALARLGREVPTPRAPEPTRSRSSRDAASTRSRPSTSRPPSLVASLAQRRAARPAIERPAKVVGPPPGVWYGIIGVVLVFVMLGLVMVLSASAVTETNRGNWAYGVFVRQAMWAGLGLVGLVVMARVPYMIWRRLTVPIAFLGIAAMLGPFAPVVGGSTNGARAWVRLGGFSVQPSEFLKLVVIIVTADLLARRAGQMNHRRNTLYPLAAIGAIGTGLCMAQGDLGSAIVLGAVVFAIAWIAGVPFAPMALMGSIASAAGLFFVFSSATRTSRFTAFLDVEGNKDLLSWQVYQGYVSIASGGIGGSGIGGSKTKFGDLPYAHSDFIFAIIADELGMLGAGAVIGGFMMLVWFGVQTALAAPDRFGMYVAGGVASWFGVQAVVNLGGVTGLLPVTGLTLPFFSAGGSSLFASMIAAGLLLSVARRAGSRGGRSPVRS